MLKRHTVLAVASATFLALTSSYVLAQEQDYEGSIADVVAVLKELDKKGYAGVKSIELEEGFNTGYEYEVTGIDKNGQFFKLEIDAQTGKVPELRTIPHFVSVLTVAKSLEKAGYDAISKIALEYVDGMYYYQVRAINDKGEKVKVIVNAISGVEENKSQHKKAK